MIRNMFRRPTPAEVAADRLAQSELAMLDHQQAVDYSTAQLAYHRAQISGLQAVLSDSAEFKTVTFIGGAA